MGTVHVVATPIGNLEDITLRALRVLREADLLFAEDTRRTRVLLDHFEIPGRPISLASHNERARVERALDCLRTGGNVAIVSDAGTPLISDPGERLVTAAIEDGHRVEAIPGASAVLSALACCGLRTQPFVFVGFPPRKAGARKRLFDAYRDAVETIVLFESPRRIGGTLSELAVAFGPDRRAAVARELTKLHEEIVRGTLADLAERFAAGARGEVTLVVEGREDRDQAGGRRGEEGGVRDIDEEIRALFAQGCRPREIASRLAPGATLPRREIYARAVALRAQADAPT